MKTAEPVWTDSNGRPIYEGDRVWIGGRLYTATQRGPARLGGTTSYWTWAGAGEPIVKEMSR